MARSSHPLDHLDLTPGERRRLLVQVLAEVLLRLQSESEAAPSRHIDQAEFGPDPEPSRRSGLSEVLPEEAPSLAEKDPQDSSVSGLASRPEQSVDVQGA